MSASDPSVVAGYRRALGRRGQDVTFRRVVGQAPNTVIVDATVAAIVMDYVPEAAVMAVKREGAITQGGRHIIVLAADLAEKHFPLPLVKHDKAIVNGESLDIFSVDPNKRGLGGAIDVLAVGT